MSMLLEFLLDLLFNTPVINGNPIGIFLLDSLFNILTCTTIINSIRRRWNCATVFNDGVTDVPLLIATLSESLFNTHTGATVVNGMYHRRNWSIVPLPVNYYYTTICCLDGVVVWRGGSICGDGRGVMQFLVVLMAWWYEGVGRWTHSEDGRGMTWFMDVILIMISSRNSKTESI